MVDFGQKVVYNFFVFKRGVMFLGTYFYQKDDKNRIRLPKAIKQLCDDEKLYITKGFGNCLFVMTEKVFKDKIISQLEKHNTLDPELYACMSMIMSATEEFEGDQQGRYTIPSSLLEYADIKKDICILGVGDRIEIWNSDRWQDKVNKFDANFDKNFKKAIEVLNKNGI